MSKYPLLEQHQAVQPTGLFSLGWYLGYTKGYEKATLDGEFTAAELKEIARFMEEEKP